MYERNFLYISSDQQTKMGTTKVLLGGAGLGSVIAEAALRLGFKRLVLIDGDSVEKSNLNRQNYTIEDIGVSKVEALRKRLLQIDPEAKIDCHHVFLNQENLHHYIKDCDIAINAIDFTSEAPFLFDKICQQEGIPVLHPYNFGWAGCVYVMTPQSRQLYELSEQFQSFEFVIANHTIQYLEQNTSLELDWLYDFISQYQHYKHLSPSQLAVGSWLVGGMVANLLFCLTNGIEVKTFPEPYFLSSRGDKNHAAG